MKILVVGDFQGKFSEKMFDSIKKEEFDFIVSVGDYAGIDYFYPYLIYCFRYWSKGDIPPKNAEQFFGKKKLKRLIKKDNDCAKMVLKKLNSVGKPVISVYGNGDDAFHTYPFGRFFKAKKGNVSFVKKLKNIKDITYSRTKLNGINFSGFGGFMDVDANWKDERKSKKNPESYKRMLERSAKSKKKFYKLINSKTDILVLHYPPKGIFDVIKDKKNPYSGGSAGIKFFREGILKFKPKLVLCGHMHEYQGAKKLGKSIVINPGDAEKGKYAIIDYDKDIRVRFVK